MKKVFYCTALLMFVTLAALVMRLNSDPVSNHQTSEASQQLFPDGPDKALWHNRLMIEDRNEGRIPYERLLDARKFELQARKLSSRDFQWTNWDTKIPGRGRMILYHSASGTLYTGSSTGGLWKNADFKNNAAWEYINSFDGIAVNCMATDPNNADKFYIGTGESFTAFVNYRESTGVGRGIYKSVDGGATWAQIPSTNNFYFINDLIIRDEDGTSVIYAAVGSGEYRSREFVQEGLYRSKDDGATWQQVLPAIQGTGELYQVSDLELSPTNQIIAGTMRNSNTNGGGTILYSNDGDTWNVYSDFADNAPVGSFPGRVVVKAAPSNPSHLYALLTLGYYNNLGQLRDYEVHMRQSLNGGTSWSPVQLPGGWANIPWHALSLAIDPENENKIIVAGLNMFVLNDASNPAITPLDWIRISDWTGLSYEDEPGVTQEFKDSIAKHYVHADIHDIQFINGSSDQVLMTTDGGAFFTENMSVSNNIDPENPVQEFPLMKQLNNGLNTTQFYYARLHPQKGTKEMIGGTQDNGSIWSNSVTDKMISGGDGGYSFWDSDNPELKITTVYGNRYFTHIGSDIYFEGPINGLFVNPMDYDEEANLLYSNMATSPVGGLYGGIKGRYYDSLEIFNLNKYTGTTDNALENMQKFTFVKLNGGIDEAITAIKLSKHSSKFNKTAVIGTENGKIYKVKALPFAPATTRIDNNQLPSGYVSSVDIGDNENRILVTMSNFGIESVWVTLNGGQAWISLERDLPDIPVRWGLFNPFDSHKILIATELGIWGLENISDNNELWSSYNLGLPECRVDMIDIRTSDSTILAATHGYGIWVGKLDQGGIITHAGDELTTPSVNLYPNPTYDVVKIESDVLVASAVITNLQGRRLEFVRVTNQQLSLASLNEGLYIVECFDSQSRSVARRKIYVMK